MRYPELVLFGLVAASACRPADQLEIRFVSPSQGNATSELRLFLFADGADGRADCEALDPRGLGPGDAPARTGLTPTAQEVLPPDADEVQLPKVPDGRYSVVLEAWGPACEEVQSGATETICARLATSSGPSVLRGYYCNSFELGSRRVDGAADLFSFADVGASMTVPIGFPAEAERFDEDAPLLVVEGLPAPSRLTVQLLDGTSDEQNDVKVRYMVESGAGTILEPQPLLTATDPRIQDQGLVHASLRAEAYAAGRNEGKIVVIAHAPGFEGSPVRFYAKALPSVEVELERVVLPASAVNLGGLDATIMPVDMADLNSDGRLDLVTAVGYDSHRLLIHYGGADQLHLGPVLPRQVRALAVTRLQPGLPSVVVSVADRASNVLADTPHGRTYTVTQPGLEIYSGLGAPDATGTLAGPVRILDTVDGVPLDKVASSMTAADLDGDGVDELAVSRCSYLKLQDGGQSPLVRCFGGVNDRTDSEMALYVATGSASLSQKAVIPCADLRGGFRELKFADLDGDSSQDLVVTSNTQVHGACGRRFQREVGFGLNEATVFEASTDYSNNYSVTTGQFDDVPGQDVVVAGSIRAASTEAGFKAVGGRTCTGFDAGPPPLDFATKTNPQFLAVRAANLNGDAYDDLILLHRSNRTLSVFLGGGRLRFAPGPQVELPTGLLSEMALGTELGPSGAEVVAGMTAPSENALYRVRFRHR